MKQHGFIVKQTDPLKLIKTLSIIFLKNLEQVKYTMLSSSASDIIKIWSFNDCNLPRYF